MHQPNNLCLSQAIHALRELELGIRMEFAPNMRCLVLGGIWWYKPMLDSYLGAKCMVPTYIIDIGIKELGMRHVS